MNRLVRATLFFCVCAVAYGCAPAGTQVAKGKTVDPTLFLGRTLKQCEQVLGKPLKLVPPSGKFRGSGADFKSGIAAVARIRLMRQPEGRMDGPIPNTVNSVTYYFPKGKLKSGRDALAVVGIPVEGVTAGEFGNLEGIPGGLRGEWETADKATTGPDRLRHPIEDALTIQRAK